MLEVEEVQKTKILKQRHFKHANKPDSIWHTVLSKKKKYRNNLSMFFQGLYKKKSVSEEGLREYLKDILITMFTPEHRRKLNQTITIQDFFQAIRNTKKDWTGRQRLANICITNILEKY